MSRYSNSYINEYARCPLSSFFRYEKHLHRIDDDSTSNHHLAYGRAMHKAFEVLYLEGDAEKAKVALRENYPVQLDPNDFAKTADNGCFVIDAYIKNFAWDKDWEVVAVEGMDATDDGFVVKPDLIVKDRNSNILCVDHKFTGRYLNYDFFADFDPNSQITQYIRYVKERYGACDGFVVNAVALRYRQRAYKGEPAGFWVAFERQTFNRTPSQIDRTVKSTEAWIADIERSKAAQYWRANESPNGCKFCSYRGICSTGWSWEEDSELILSSYRTVCEKFMPETGEHCMLDLDHAGEHDGSVQVANAPVEFTVEV